MTTDLGQRLDDLAALETDGLDLRDPTFPTALDPYRHSRPARGAIALAVVAACIVLVGGWWISRDDTSTVDVAGPFDAVPVPALLLETPTPFAELDENVQQTFTRTAPPSVVHELSSNEAPVVFDGVHVVEIDEENVFVGLDNSKSVLCLSVLRTDDQGGQYLSGSCESPAAFARDGVMSAWLTGTRIGTTSAVLVPDGVVAVEVGSVEAEVVRNIATFDVEVIGDELRLHLADGTVQLASALDSSSGGTVALSSGDELSLAEVGCALRPDGFVVEGTFIDAGLLLVVVTPDGVHFTGGEGAAPDGVMGDATVEAANVDGSLVVSASWTGPTPGSLRLDCGNRLVDFTAAR